MKLLGIVLGGIGFCSIALAFYSTAFIPIPRLEYEALIPGLTFIAIGAYFVLRSRSQRFGLCHIFLLIAVSAGLLGCGHVSDAENLEEFVKMHGPPAFAVKSAKLDKDTLYLRGARTFTLDTDEPEWKLLKGMTIVYVKNKLASEQMQLAIPAVLSLGADLDNPQLIYSMIPPVFVDCKAKEIKLVSESPSGVIKKEELGKIKMVVFMGGPPDPVQ